jgi:hypothetical protein
MDPDYIPNTTRWAGHRWHMNTLHRDIVFDHVFYLPTVSGKTWNCHLKKSGIQSSFYQLCDAFSAVFFNFRYRQNCTGDLAPLFFDLWEGTINRHLLPSFRIVECFASVIQSGTFPRRQLNVENIGKREVLIESIVCVAGQRFIVELLLRLPRRWMVRFIWLHHVYLLIEAVDYEREGRLINH